MYKYDSNKCQFIKISLKYWGIALLVISFVSILIGGISYYVGFNNGEKEIVFEPIYKPYKDTARTSFVNLDYNQIRKIESNNNDEAISAMNAVGSMQITQTALDEWNKSHPNNEYAFDDLFDSRINHKVGRWLLKEQIPMYLKTYKIPEKLTYKLIIYNAGIGSFLKAYDKKHDQIRVKDLPEETRDYIVKYYLKY